MKPSRIIISLLGLIGVYYAGVGYRKWQASREERAAVEARKDFVILYDFMGAKQFPFEGRVLESRGGYIKVVMPNGQVYEHSGRYSIIKN